ncbi:MAG: hypothetical protein V8T87_10445 [Victivallales bacterium]
MRWDDLNVIHLYEKGKGAPTADILIGGDFCPLRNYESRLLRETGFFRTACHGCFISTILRWSIWKRRYAPPPCRR